MTTLGKLLITTFIGVTALTTTVSADSGKGQKIYAKKLKSVCDMSGAVFAAKHTQMEWEDAEAEGTLAETMTEACPAGKDFFESDKFDKKFKKHLYDFVHEFASDSGNIPSC